MHRKESPLTWRKDIILDFQVGPPLLVAAVIIRELTPLERMAMSAGWGWGVAAIFFVSLVGGAGMILIGSGLYKLIRHRKHLDEVKRVNNKEDK